MTRSILMLAALALAGIPLAAAASLPPSRVCSAPTTITPVANQPGVFRLESRSGAMLARWPTRPSAAARSGAIVTVQVRAFHFDIDDDVVGTERDTLIIAPGTTVRFQLAAGIHTVTNGYDSGDPTAGTVFSVLLDSENPTFDTTFTAPTQLDYFCYFHEPVMGGTIIVRQNAGVPGGSNLGRASFSRIPSPNPARGITAFSIALPRSTRVRLDVLDLSGRRLFTLHNGELASGEHSFRWDGRTDRSGGVASGRYQIRLLADGVTETRAVTLLR